MRWLGCFFIFMGIKMATDGVLRGLGIMRPFLIANMVNLAIRLSVALICAPRFGIAFVWLAVLKQAGLPTSWFPMRHSENPGRLKKWCHLSKSGFTENLKSFGMASEIINSEVKNIPSPVHSPGLNCPLCQTVYHTV